MYDNMPIVKSYFNISGNYIDFEKVNKSLNVEPTKTRTKEEWPAAIKDNTELPDEMKPRYEWAYIKKYEDCFDIDEPFEELMETFSSKIIELNELKMKYDFDYHILVTIDADEMSLPAMIISKKMINFLHSIQAEISFDIMTYHEEE